MLNIWLDPISDRRAKICWAAAWLPPPGTSAALSVVAAATAASVASWASSGAAVPAAGDKMERGLLRRAYSDEMAGFFLEASVSDGKE